MSLSEESDQIEQRDAGNDAIVSEIVRHRLWAIADEMAMTLIKTAGSPSITERHDFIVAVFTADGDLALGGWGANRHVSCTAVACRGIIERFSLSDIHEDDVFLLNDPYVAAIHQQDVYIISPVHFDGVLVGWVANFTHLPDIGGIDPGWSIRATEVTQEGLRIPGLKIVDRGILRQDVWDTILNMTREPEMNALQLKAQMAANHTGKEKMRGLIKKTGIGRYRTIVSSMIKHSERALRARLRQMPDGIWRTREYFDTKDRLYRVELAMTKQGESLSFDFSGTSEQSRNFINCTYWGARGGVFVSVSSMLGFGLSWNEGLLKPIHLDIPEGTLLNCKFPAPVSMGTVAASRLATIASWSTISSMLAMSDKYKGELSALWSVSSTGVNFSGINRENRYFVGSLSAGAGGGGARLFADGIDTGGGSNNLMSSNSNVENMERNTPILCLFQRQLPNSGGAGAHRGGVSAEIAVALHKAPKGSISGDIHGSGLEPAQSHGLFGGFPSCNTLFEIHSGTTIREALRNGLPLEPGSLGGQVTRLPPQALFEIDENSIFYIRADGGGGLGDPLFRSPNTVLADVQSGLVTVAQAQKIYGVLFDESVTTVDERGTGQLRQELRTKRLGGNRPAKSIAASIKSESMIPAVVIHPELQYALCAACGRRLAPIDMNWKERALEYSQPLQELNELMISTQFVLRSFICPDCGTVLDAEMVLPSDPYINIYSPIDS